jgi:hypothetical protein
MQRHHPASNSIGIGQLKLVVEFPEPPGQGYRAGPANDNEPSLALSMGPGMAAEATPTG